MITELLCLLLALLAIIGFQTTRVPKGMPPGSFGLPIIGHLPARGVHITKHFQQLKDRYGKIFSTKMGSRPTVVIADSQLVKKALNLPQLQGRPGFFSFVNFITSSDIGVVNAYGQVWTEHRRFMLRHLRNLGMGKSRLEDCIVHESKMLVEYMEKHLVGRPVELDTSINTSILNTMWQLLASRRYDADDEEAKIYNTIILEMFAIIQGPVRYIDLMPWLLKVLPSAILKKHMKYDKILEYRNLFKKYFEQIIEEHQETLDEEHPKDIVDHYLLEIKAEKDNPETVFREDYLGLLAIMSDMFAAGTETTSTTLRWLCLHMASNQQLQSKVQEAIDAVVPRDRLPSLEDREQLGFVDAVIFDLMRLISLLPTSVPHEASSTIVFEGYTIPKGTLILPALGLCHIDPDLWEEPEKLHPQHFLDKDGKFMGKREGFMAFSLGRRQCLGESLARMEVFLKSSAILQQFKISLPSGTVPDLTSDPDNTFFNIPKPFKVVLEKRI